MSVHTSLSPSTVIRILGKCSPLPATYPASYVCMDSWLLDSMSQNRVPDFVAQTVLALAVGSFEGPSCALVTCHVLFKALPDFLVPGEAPG